MYHFLNYICVWLIISIGIICPGCAVKEAVTDFEPIINENLPVPNLQLTIPGMSNCTSDSDIVLRLNSSEPVVIIVHGCYSSAANSEKKRVLPIVPIAMSMPVQNWKGFFR